MSTLSSRNLLKFRWSVYFTTILLMSIAWPAFAQISKAQRAREQEAKKACLAGKNSYEQGIEILAELYATTNEPTYIYNQGRCYQQNNQPELALSRFQEYLRKDPKMSFKEKATLERYMAECKEQVAQTQPPSPPAQPAPQPVRIRAVEEPAPTETISAPETAMEPVARPGRGLRIAGVTTATLGLLTLGGAATLNWLYSDNQKSWSEGEAWTPKNESRNNDYKTFALIGYVAGAATVTTGIILYVVGWNSGNAEETNLALLPLISPHATTLSLQGTF